MQVQCCVELREEKKSQKQTVCELVCRVCLCLCVEQNAKHDEAWMILKQVHDTNWRAKGQPEKVFTVSLVDLYYPV